MRREKKIFDFSTSAYFNIQMIHTQRCVAAYLHTIYGCCVLGTLTLVFCKNPQYKILTLQTINILISYQQAQPCHVIDRDVN